MEKPCFIMLYHKGGGLLHRRRQRERQAVTVLRAFARSPQKSLD